VNAMPAMKEEDDPGEIVKLPYLTRKQAAALVHVSTWTIDAWAREPDFPMWRLSARTRVIPREEFVAWLKEYSARLANPLTPKPEPPASRSMRGRR